MSKLVRRLALLGVLIVLACGCAGVSEILRPRIVTDGLVAHYDFDEGSGEVACDATGRGNDGAIRGAVFVEMATGYALKFDGVDDYVDCGSSEDLDPAYEATVEVWVRPEALPEGHEPGIVGKTYAWYGFTYHRSGNCFWYISSGSNQLYTKLPLNEWHHLVGTFDGVTTSIYLDGRHAASRESKYAIISEGKNFYIARSQIKPDKTHGGYFKGMIDQVRVYDRALTAEEVKTNFEATRLQYPDAESSAPAE